MIKLWYAQNYTSSYAKYYVIDYRKGLYLSFYACFQGLETDKDYLAHLHRYRPISVLKPEYGI